MTGKIRQRLAAAWETFDRLPLARRALISAIFAANLALAAAYVFWMLFVQHGYDWAIYVEAGRRVVEGGLYDWDQIYAWSYSPVLAYVFTVLTPIGFWGWAAVHVIALAALPSRRLTLVAGLSWPFWVDVYLGNTITFVFVAAALAIRGRPVGVLAFCAFALLMPRPLMLPLLCWILWKRPRWIPAFVILAVAHLIIAYWTGHLFQWAQVLTGVGEAVAKTSLDIGPGALIGTWWIVIGGLLAVVLTIRGRIGLASLAASPYWLSQYFLMLVLEFAPVRGEASDEHESPPGRPTESGKAGLLGADPMPSVETDESNASRDVVPPATEPEDLVTNDTNDRRRLPA